MFVYTTIFLKKLQRNLKRFQISQCFNGSIYRQCSSEQTVSFSSNRKQTHLRSTDILLSKYYIKKLHFKTKYQYQNRLFLRYFYLLFYSHSFNILISQNKWFAIRVIVVNIGSVHSCKTQLRRIG